MDPNWKPSEPDDFISFMDAKKMEYNRTHAGTFNTVHVTEWAHEYVKKLNRIPDASPIETKSLENNIDESALGCEPDTIVKRNPCRDCGKKWWFELSNCYVCINCRKTLGKSSSSTPIETRAQNDPTTNNERRK